MVRFSFDVTKGVAFFVTNSIHANGSTWKTNSQAGAVYPFREQGISPSRIKFEPEKVHAARIIAGHHDAAVRTGAALHTGIASRLGDLRASLQVPDLEGIVAGSGDRAPVRRHRHAKDPIGMAGERAQLAAGLRDPTP